MELRIFARPVRFHPSRRTRFLVFSYLCVISLAPFGVRALRAETVQGCSTLNARVIVRNLGESTEDTILMREDGQILRTMPVCGDGAPFGNIEDELLDNFSDGLFRFVNCGANGTTSTSYVNSDGQLVLTVPSAKTGQFAEGLAPIANAQNVWGYMDRSGGTVIEPQFDRVSRFSEGLAAVELKGQWEYIDKTGAVVFKVPPPVSRQPILQAEPFNSGLALILYDLNGPSYVVDHSGRRVMRGVYDFNHGLAQKFAHGKLGFIDPTGKTVIAPQFTYAPGLPFQDGLAAIFVGEGKDQNAGFIDPKGRWVIPAQYEDALHFCDGLAPVKVNGRWGYIDVSNKMVIAPKFDDAESFNYSMGAVLEREADGKLHREFVNREG
jgi:hypothetical protein